MSAWEGSKSNSRSELHQQTEGQGALIAQAIEVAKAWPVFPLKADKTPIFDGGFKGAVRNTTFIRKQFSHPDAKLIGVPTGPDTFDALDLDPRHGSDEWRARYIDRLPETRIHATPGLPKVPGDPVMPGEHYLFQHAPGVRNIQDGKTIARGVDVRGDGGYIVVPPSPGYGIKHEAPIAPWPDWLLALVVKKDKPPPPKPAQPTIKTDQLEQRYRAYIDKLLANVREAKDGTKHDTLLKNARALGGVMDAAGISEADALALLLNGLPDTVQDWDNAERTALAGLRHGRAEPIELEDREKSRGTGNGKANDKEQEQETKRDADEISLADLEREVIEPLRWIVPEYIPEGLTVFAGRPKIGKSWLILGAALAIARGKETLGQYVEKGDVLYCGLEDGKRRMQSRVDKILGPANKGWPANFTFRSRLAPLDQGGFDVLEQWLATHPKRRLIVIDVLGKVRGMKARNEEPYQYDYRLVSGLQELATRYRVAIVIVHHVRKSDAEDVLDTISGTTGIAGACDTALVLGRTKHGVRLAGRGRDSEEVDKLVEFDPETGVWSVTGEYDEAVPDSETASTRRAIYDLLEGSPVPLTPVKIAERINKQRGVVRMVLHRMLKNVPPQIEQNPDGSYTLPSRARA